MFKYLGSVKLTIVLLILIVAASIVGTLVPQNLSAEQYNAKYGDVRYNFMKNLQLLDVYHSYWFTALLTIFCVNLCVCSVQSFGPLMKSLQRSSATAGRVDLQELPFYRKIKLSASAKAAGSEETIQKIEGNLARNLYRLKFADTERGICYFERGKLGRLGPLITHASIVIIVLAAIFVAVLGFKDYINIPVDATMDIPNTDFQIRVDDFRIELYPESNTPKDFISVLTVIDNDVPKLTKAIEVNHPLEYKGVKFFQSSYGLMPGGGTNAIEVEISKAIPDNPDGEVIGKFKVKTDEMFQVPESQLKIKLIALMPDFVIDSSGQVHTRSMNMNNPAALLELYEGDELKDKSWSFLRFPEFPHQKQSDYLMKFVSVDEGPKKYYTGLQISYDPGISFIWFGCLIMVIGMFLSFYLQFKRVWVRLSSDSLEMGGRSYKNKVSFEKEFARLNTLLGEDAENI